MDMTSEQSNIEGAKIAPPAVPGSDEFRSALADVINKEISGLLYCTRTWQVWWF